MSAYGGSHTGPFSRRPVSLRPFGACASLLPGKSTLLRCLGQRQSEGVQRGVVAYNGAAFAPALHGRHLAFMGQDDAFIAEVATRHTARWGKASRRIRTR